MGVCEVFACGAFTEATPWVDRAAKGHVGVGRTRAIRKGEGGSWEFSPMEYGHMTIKGISNKTNTC